MYLHSLSLSSPLFYCLCLIRFIRAGMDDMGANEGEQYAAIEPNAGDLYHGN